MAPSSSHALQLRVELCQPLRRANVDPQARMLLTAEPPLRPGPATAMATAGIAPGCAPADSPGRSRATPE